MSLESIDLDLRDRGPSYVRLMRPASILVGLWRQVGSSRFGERANGLSGSKQPQPLKMRPYHNHAVAGDRGAHPR